MSSDEMLLPGETYWNEEREQVMTEIFGMVDKDGNGTCGKEGEGVGGVGGWVGGWGRRG